VSDIVREALKPIWEPVDSVSDTVCPASTCAVTVSAFQMDQVSASMSDASDMRERLAQLEQRVEDLSAVGARV